MFVANASVDYNVVVHYAAPLCSMAVSLVFVILLVLQLWCQRYCVVLGCCVVVNNSVLILVGMMFIPCHRRCRLRQMLLWYWWWCYCS